MLATIAEHVERNHRPFNIKLMHYLTYIYRNNQVANIGRRALAIKYGLLKGKPISYYRYDQNVHYSTHKVY